MEKTIVVIAAMEDIELDWLKNKLNNIKETKYKKFRFYEGNIKEKKIVLAVSGIGLINAAIATTIAIERYNPDIIINAGVAGGYTKNIHKGDIVVGTESINITSMEYKGKGNAIEDYEITTFLHNEENRVISQKADEMIINTIKQSLNGYNLIYGVIGSGDIWNKNPERIDYINKRYNAICEDMESIAIYSAANLYEIPAVCIKGISNNEILGEEYDITVAEKLQGVVEDIIKVL